MFGHRFFGARYFGPRYFGPAAAGSGSEASALAGRRQGAFAGRSSPIPRNRLKGTLTAHQARKS